MHKFIETDIQQGDNVVIGLGDSFTQGVGAYSDDTWKKHNGKIDVHTEVPELVKEQYRNSWVKILADKLGYKALNLGHAGTGNRSAVKELYFHPKEMSKINKGIVVYFLSGLERFDFVNKDLSSEHHHFQAMWPNFWDKNATHPGLWRAYAEAIYSEKFVAAELMLNLFEAQEFCRSRDFKLVVASAFDMRVTRDKIANIFNAKGLGVPSCVIEDDFVDQFDWSQFCAPKGYTTFMELLCDLEGNKSLASGRYFDHFTKMPYPSKYITNCAHPSLEGHKVIAEEFYRFINES